MPTNESSHRHLKQKPAARRKSKPKYEIPVETAQSEAPVAWVYRPDEVPVAPMPVPSPAPTARHQEANPGPLLLTGMVLIAFGAGTIGLVSWVALNLSTAPIRMAKRLLARSGEIS